MTPNNFKGIIVYTLSCSFQEVTILEKESKMSYCQNCGATLKEEAAFCNNCGTAQKPCAQKERGKIHCPSCASRNVSITSESGGASAVTAVDRNFWFCADCGTKFRSIPSLEEEIKKRKTAIVGFLIAAGVLFALGIWMLFFALDGLFGAFFFVYAFFLFAGAIAFAIAALYYQNLRKKQQTELLYLKENCFH